MVRYYGRNKLITTAVNGNQIGLKMGGGTSSIGGSISTKRYTKRRVRDNLKYCGPVYYRGQLWSFNGSNCVKKAPFRQASAGGVGNINNPRKKCNISCSVDIDNCDICDAIKLIRQYFIYRFGQDGIVLVAPQETLQSDGINDVINGKKIYHFDSNHAEYFTLPRKVREAVDAVNNLKLKYRLKDSTDKIVHIVGYIAPILQKKLREKFFGNYKETFGSGSNEEILYAFGHGVNRFQLIEIIKMFRNANYESPITYSNGEIYKRLNDIPTGSVTDMSYLFQGDKKIGGPNGQNTEIMKIDEWDTSNVRNMIYMFEGASNFNQNISGWDVSWFNEYKDTFSKLKAIRGKATGIFKDTSSSWKLQHKPKIGNIYSQMLAKIWTGINGHRTDSHPNYDSTNNQLPNYSLGIYPPGVTIRWPGFAPNTFPPNGETDILKVKKFYFGA